MMDTATAIQFHLRTKVRFANGAFATAGAEAAALGKVVMIVTGRSAMRKAGLTQRLVAQVEAAGARAVLYEEASPNPTTGEVDAGVASAVREGVDVVVGLGGGSAMDVAKAIAITTAYGKPCYELCGVSLTEPGLPVVAITTTSGTGAEVSGVAVVTEPTRHHKTALRAPSVAPTVAIVDPELALTVPPVVTASSGMDALAHAVESYLSRNASPFTEIFAERATELVLANLRSACDDGGNLSARTGMALANLMAGVTLAQAGVILGHGVGMTLGGFFGTDHGATVGRLLPAVLEETLPAAQGRLATLARRIGLVPALPGGPADAEAAAALIGRIRQLIASIPLGDALAPLRTDLDSVLPELVKGVLAQAATRNNPSPVTEASAESFLRRVAAQ